MRASRLKSTAYYEYANANPKDRLGADCVVRALAIATGRSWESVVRDLTEFGIKRARVLNDMDLFPAWLEAQGFVARKEPRDAYNKKMSLKEFLASHPDVRDFVALVGSHHVTVVQGGKAKDIWDCSGQTIHRWWEKPSRE